ncbi:hypothetical protein TARUN_4228 [Trichoderma arundinaceum]|uniref:Uncharacterized protein n=1 Tax=Trichoderma arundinaceum TaxID=490622 RepID=A0A395NPY5_TRIAR|nr:hypothetical protein TARUN_4228 [Trichoderma arundinaceum]
MSRSLAGAPVLPANQPQQRRVYSDVFAKWPKQDLRPDYQFQDVLAKVVDERFKTYKPSVEPEELLKARALQFLLQNKFRDRVRNDKLLEPFVRGGFRQISLTNGLQYKLKGPMLQPKSQPTYFEDLVREIEEAPKRTWLERLGKRLSGMIRLQ